MSKRLHGVPAGNGTTGREITGWRITMRAAEDAPAIGSALAAFPIYGLYVEMDTVSSGAVAIAVVQYR